MTSYPGRKMNMGNVDREKVGNGGVVGEMILRLGLCESDSWVLANVT